MASSWLSRWFAPPSDEGKWYTSIYTQPVTAARKKYLSCYKPQCNSPSTIQKARGFHLPKIHYSCSHESKHIALTSRQCPAPFRAAHAVRIWKRCTPREDTNIAIVYFIERLPEDSSTSKPSPATVMKMYSHSSVLSAPEKGWIHNNVLRQPFDAAHLSSKTSRKLSKAL